MNVKYSNLVPRSSSKVQVKAKSKIQKLKWGKINETPTGAHLSVNPSVCQSSEKRSTSVNIQLGRLESVKRTDKTSKSN